MQCARCSRPLPENGRLCLFCGLPVNPADGDGAPSEAAAQATTAAAAASVPSSAPTAAGQTEADFVFQEFVAPASAPRPAAPAPVPFPAPPAGAPGYPGALPPPFPPAGQVGYPPPGVPLVYAPMPMPAAPAPARKRRGLSTGWIILYVFLGLAVLFTGVGFAAVRIGDAVGGSIQASNNAKKAAAMQLYQQVTSQSPTLQDPLTDPNTTNWNTFDRGAYSCSAGTDGLRVSMDEANHFTFCTYTSVHIASIAFQVQMQILSGDAGGFVFRVMPTANDTAHSLYFFRVSSSGVYGVYLDKDTAAARVSRLASGITQAMDAQSQTNTLTLIAKGPVFDIYINGEYVTEVHDTTIASGEVGLLASENTSSTSVLYTNAKIWYLGN